MWGWIIFSLITIAIWVTLYFEQKKFKKLASSGKREAKDYGKNVIAGLVAGLIVVITDRGMTAVLNNPPLIDYTSFWTIVVSGSVGVIVFAFEVGLIFLLVLWIINQGLFGLVRKKK